MESITNIVDRDTFAPVVDGLTSRDPLRFAGYEDALGNARAKGGVDESVVHGAARIGGVEVELAAFNFGFLGGSMGEVAGERLARAMERAADRRVPFVLRTCTGGARMQEGMRSLLQMPKVVAARIALGIGHQPFIAVLGHPTTGGVLASVAALADVTVAEAGATIGFAGPRVAERFTGEALPEESHTATSAYAAGLVDELVSGGDVHAYVSSVPICSLRTSPGPQRNRRATRPIVVTHGNWFKRFGVLGIRKLPTSCARQPTSTWSFGEIARAPTTLRSSPPWRASPDAGS